jgi:hypothetical protein
VRKETTLSFDSSSLNNNDDQHDGMVGTFAAKRCQQKDSNKKETNNKKSD